MVDCWIAIALTGIRVVKKYAPLSTSVALACFLSSALAAPKSRPGVCYLEGLPLIPGQVAVQTAECPSGQTCKPYLCFICRDNGTWTRGYPCNSAADPRPANSPPPHTPSPTKETCDYCLQDQGCRSGRDGCVASCSANSWACKQACDNATNKCEDDAYSICVKINRCTPNQFPIPRPR
jgi:hypothetical protein